MLAPFQMKRNPHSSGEYEWKLVNVVTEMVLATGYSRNPARAPEDLRRMQARLNSKYVLDTMRIG